eukprot:727907-Pelagomonas_calceolata.AAC.1
MSLKPFQKKEHLLVAEQEREKKPTEVYLSCKTVMLGLAFKEKKKMMMAPYCFSYAAVVGRYSYVTLSYPRPARRQ